MALIGSTITFAKKTTLQPTINSDSDTKFKGTAYIWAMPSIVGKIPIQPKKYFLIADVEGEASHENWIIGFGITIDDADDCITYTPKFFGEPYTYDLTSTPYDNYEIISYGHIRDV